MILTGILEEAFNGRTLFRGFAALKDLSNSSSVDKYQRELDEKRKDNIISFFKDNESFLFFSELLFSLQFKDQDALLRIKEKQTAGLITFSNDIKVRVSNKKDKMQSFSLEFSDNIKPLKRLDGNHRLSAIDTLLSLSDTREDGSFDYDKKIFKEKMENMVVPFSILLQIESDESQKYETAYFYLINSKALPLTSEENLKAILENKSFTEIERNKLLLVDSSTLIDIIDFLSSNTCPLLMKIIEGKKYTFSLSLLNLLKDNKIEIQNLRDSLMYIEYNILNSNIKDRIKKLELILALLYYKNVNQRKFDKFCVWIEKNQLADVELISSKEIISIFDKIYEERIYKVFVAMPYYSHLAVNDFNKLFKEICTEVSKKVHIEMELIPIMRFKGRSQRIDARLIKAINECDFFIADITNSNVNVIFEVGHAEGQGKPIILFKEQSDKTLVPFDMDKLQYLPFSKYGYYNDIKQKAVNNIIELLKEDFNVFA